MRNLMLALGAFSMALPVAAVFPAASASAQSRHHHKSYTYREWRGRDGRMYCRKSDGTTGLVVGAAAGALIGRSVDTHGERATGTILGAVAGALAGREIDRNHKRHRCR